MKDDSTETYQAPALT